MSKNNLQYYVEKINVLHPLSDILIYLEVVYEIYNIDKKEDFDKAIELFKNKIANFYNLTFDNSILTAIDDYIKAIHYIEILKNAVI